MNKSLVDAEKCASGLLFHTQATIEGDFDEIPAQNLYIPMNDFFGQISEKNIVHST